MNARQPIEIPEIVPATRDEDAVPAPPRLPPDQRPPRSPAPGTRTTARRPRVRMVTRVVRHLDPWSVFKVALIFSAVTYVVVLTSGVLIWNVAIATGTVDNVERWFTQFGWESFELNGGEIFQGAWVAGLFLAVGATGIAVLLATIFNLVSDIVGGVRVTVLEEEVIERGTRRSVVRREPASASDSSPGSPSRPLSPR